MRAATRLAAILLTASAAAAQSPAGRFQPDPKLPPEQGVPYVILTDEELAPSFQKIADFKRGLGMPAQVITVDWLKKSAYYPGVDLPERLYHLLQDLRLNWRTRWVLIGGDVDVVPPQMIKAYHGTMGGNRIASDVYYSDVLPADCSDPDAVAAYGWNGNGDGFVGEAGKDGFDLVPELYVGRVPAATKEEAETWIEKYFDYENATAKDTAWLSRALVVGSHEFEERQKEVNKLFKDLGGAAYASELVVERAPKPIDAITDELNKGYAFFDFFCHGCPDHFWACNDHTSWGVAQVRLLKNSGMCPIVFANSCDTDEFDKPACLGKMILVQPKGGGVAYLGYSNLAFQSPVNEEFYRQVFSGDCPQIGRAIDTAKGKDAQDVWVGQILQLMGEPEMWVRTAAPFTPKVSGEKLFANVPGRLTVTDAKDNPVKRARVVIDASGVNIVGVSDEKGSVLLPPPAKSGAARVTVLAQNGLRFEKKVNIEAKLPPDVVAVARPALAIDDSADEPSSDKEDPKRLHGNGQKDLNPGETVKFVFTWPKESPLPDGDLVLAFEEDPFVKVVTGPEKIEHGVAFTVHAARRIPSWHQCWATLSLKVASAPDPWLWTFRQPVEGPALAIAAVAVDDSEGNKDKRVGWEDAGKKIRFSLGLYNSGTQKASGVKIVASSTDPSVTVTKPEVAFGAVTLEDIVHPKEKQFEFTLAADYDGHPLAFALAIEDDRKNKWEGHLLFTVPPAPPLQVRAEPGLKSIAVEWTPSGSPGVVGYHVYRAATEKGPFTRLTENPVKGATRFPDSTVKPMSAYAYVVTCVTADGLESRYSAAAKGFTLSPLPKIKEGK
jgi:hypothetical protein